MSGCYVYIIAPVGGSGPCKIGIAAAPNQRLKQLQTGNPMRLEVVETYWAMDRQQAAYWEMLAHKLFEDKRLAGEWFDLPPTILKGRISEWHRVGEPKAPPKRRRYVEDPDFSRDFEPFLPVFPEHLRGIAKREMTEAQRSEYWRVYDLPSPPAGFDDWYIVGSPASGVLAAFPTVGFCDE